MNFEEAFRDELDKEAGRLGKVVGGAGLALAGALAGHKGPAAVDAAKSFFKSNKPVATAKAEPSPSRAVESPKEDSWSTRNKMMDRRLADIKDAKVQAEKKRVDKPVEVASKQMREGVYKPDEAKARLVEAMRERRREQEGTPGGAKMWHRGNKSKKPFSVPLGHAGDMMSPRELKDPSNKDLRQRLREYRDRSGYPYYSKSGTQDRAR